MFKIHKEELEVNGKKLNLETGKVARQADGAIIAEVQRYMVMPGQATSYKIGMLKIQELRQHVKNSPHS